MPLRGSGRSGRVPDHLGGRPASMPVRWWTVSRDATLCPASRVAGHPGAPGRADAAGAGLSGLDLRRPPLRNAAATYLGHLLAATAVHLVRIDAWQQGRRPEPTRTTQLHRLLGHFSK